MYFRVVDRFHWTFCRCKTVGWFWIGWTPYHRSFLIVCPELERWCKSLLLPMFEEEAIMLINFKNLTNGQGTLYLALVWIATAYARHAYNAPITPGWKPCLVFWRDFGMPPFLGDQLDPKWLEFEIGMVLDLDPPEILSPGTPGVSLGTKIFSSRFFSDHENRMLFYGFCRFIMLKMLKNRKNWSFSSLSCY